MDKDLLLRILSFAKPYHRYWPRYLAFVIPGMIFGILNFALIIPVLQVVFEQKELIEIPVLPSFSLSFSYFNGVFYHYLYTVNAEWGTSGTLLFICIAVLIASLLANLFKYWAQRTLVSMRMRVNLTMRNAIFDKITRLHVGYFNSQRKGDLMSSLSNDVGEVQNSIVSSFQTILRDPILIIGNMFALFYMSYQLTLFSMIAVPISAFLIGRLSRKLRHDAGEAQKYQGDIMSIIEETITGIRIVKAFNAQAYVRDKFRSANENHRITSKRIANRQELASPMSEFFGVAVVLGLLYFGGMLVMTGRMDMSTSEFIVYIGFYYSILVPVKELTRSYTNIQRGMASAVRVFNILDQPIELLKSEHSISIKDFKDKIEFRHVSFAYSGKSSEVLHDINLMIPKGKMYALVGHSGAGKTTIADLIPRFYDVQRGSILIDGVDIKDLQPRELIALMGIVSQESILFNDTIFNNIAFGLPDVTEDEVRKAAEIANAHEFIEKMDEGYYTNIGDRGNRLSGGQRQRIAIARAVLRNPPILILDEATSALDTESERLVQDALANLMKNRTSIVIAHRLSTIQHADQIVVLQEGNIIEQGTHDELIELKGTYSNLCRLQNFK